MRSVSLTRKSSRGDRAVMLVERPMVDGKATAQATERRPPLPECELEEGHGADHARPVTPLEAPSPPTVDPLNEDELSQGTRIETDGTLLRP
jgi:hypothetical protein